VRSRLRKPRTPCGSDGTPACLANPPGAVFCSLRVKRASPFDAAARRLHALFDRLAGPGTRYSCRSS
jgi:hypothetical protein